MKTDEQWMKLALKEAAKGYGRTSPNPPVGAVIVKKGKLIAKGYHRQAGGDHAEVIALKKAGRKAKGATIYVTLEPCAHHGKTPPCTDAILKSGIKQVVVGARDPNRKSKNGCAVLRRQKIAVTAGILKKECDDFYLPFKTFIKEKRPFVILKAAVTFNGKMYDPSSKTRWITSAESRQHLHRQRHQIDAILVGVDTILRDNPRLTTRLKNSKGNDPVRIILDSKLRCPATARILKQQSTAPTFIATTKKASQKKRQQLAKAGAYLITCRSHQGQVSLKDLLKRLAELEIMTLMVEGGPTVHHSFLKEGLVDQVQLYIAQQLFKQGIDFPYSALESFLAKTDYQPTQPLPIGPDFFIKIS